MKVVILTAVWIRFSIADKYPPTITCPSNYVAELDANGQVFVSPFFLVTVSDNCGIPSFPLNGQLHDCLSVGQAYQATYISIDAAGNSSSCIMNYTVEDNRDPIVSCKTFVASVGQSGSITINPSDVEDALSTDNCGVFTKSVFPNTFSCLDAGLNNVTLTVTDVNGNVSTCNAVVEILCSTALPVELSDFEVKEKENGIEVYWVTQNELNNNYFSIEHSQDGVSFSSIGTKPGKVLSNQASFYRFLHPTPSLGSNYYRIRQVDIDGQFKLGPIRHLFYSLPGEKGLFIYPNPTADFVHYKIKAANSDNLQVTIFNTSQRVLYKGFGLRSISIQGWPPGLYWLKVEDGHKTYQKPFIVKIDKN